MSSYSKRDIVLYLILPAILLTAFIILLFDTDNRINQKNIEYIESLGWEVSEKCTEISYVTIPEDTDPELAPYKGRRAVLYTYTILNHPDSETQSVQINLFLYKRKIIAANISVFSANGGVSPLLNRE